MHRLLPSRSKPSKIAIAGWILLFVLSVVVLHIGVEKSFSLMFRSRPASDDVELPWLTIFLAGGLFHLFGKWKHRLDRLDDGLFYLRIADPSAASALADFLSDGEPKAAYRLVAKLKPLSPEGWFCLGICEDEQGRHSEAVAAYRQAINLKPEYPEAWCGLGLACRYQVNGDDAVAACRQAIRLKQDYLEAWFSLAECYEIQSRYDDAVVAYREIIKLKPRDAEAWHNISVAYWRQGKQPEARDALNHLRKLDRSLASELAGFLSR